MTFSHIQTKELCMDCVILSSGRKLIYNQGNRICSICSHKIFYVGENLFLRIPVIVIKTWRNVSRFNVYNSLFLCFVCAFFCVQLSVKVYKFSKDFLFLFTWWLIVISIIILLYYIIIDPVQIQTLKSAKHGTKLCINAMVNKHLLIACYVDFFTLLFLNSVLLSCKYLRNKSRKQTFFVRWCVKVF